MDFKASMPSMPSMPSGPTLPSNPISESQQEQIKEETKKFLEHFGKTFATTYKSKLIEKVKQDLNGEEISEFQLLRKESPGPKVVKVGELTKRGKIVKSWKRRHFVIKTNGLVEYFSDPNLVKPLGVINLAGYTVEAQPQSASVKDKPHSFMLMPPEKGMRKWYLVADSEEEKQLWLTEFNQACKVAEGYTNPDPIVKQSFIVAHSSVRRFYCLWQRNPLGTETDTLSRAIYERLMNVLLRDILRDLNDSVAKIAESSVKGIISAAVEPLWRGLEKMCEKTRPKVEETLKKVMKPFVDTENKIKETISTNLGDKFINPAVEKIFSPFLSKIFGIIYIPLTEAFAEQVLITSTKMKEIAQKDSNEHVKELQKSLNVKKATQKLPNKHIDNWLSGVDKILGVIGELNDVGGLASKLKEELNTTIKPTVELIFPNSIEVIMLNASDDFIYTYEVELSKSVTPDVASQSTLEKLIHDLRLHYAAVITESMKEFISGPFNTYVADHAIEFVSQLNDMIPEEFHDFVDPAGLVADVIDETLTNAIKAAVGTAITEQTLRISL